MPTHKQAWKILLWPLGIELFLLIGLALYPYWNLISFAVAFIIVVVISVLAYYVFPASRKAIREFENDTKKRDLVRILLGLIFLLASWVLFNFYSLLHLQFADTSLTLYLGLYLTGLPILIDGYWPK